MTGRHKIIVQNNKLHYEFEIRRNITIIQGDSATGKTTLIQMLRQDENLGKSSGIDVICDVPCKVLEGANWKLLLRNLAGNIIFADEENEFINTEEFASEIKNSDNYFVLITRENLYNLPYSVEEIYGIHTSGKYHDTRKIYQQIYQIYSDVLEVPAKPEKLVVEDSNSGYQFFETIAREKEKQCESAGGKSNLFGVIKEIKTEETCVIADGAAIGPEMGRLYKQSQMKKNIKLYFPESFEWLILKSGIIHDKEIEKILEEPEKYVDSKNYFSWERYFTRLLVECTENTYLQYQKSRLNEVYLHEKNKEAILQCIKGILL